MDCMCTDDGIHKLSLDEGKGNIFHHPDHFCEAMFHCTKSYEWNFPFLCVNTSKCYRTVIYSIAKLEQKGEKDYIARYKNCYRGSTDKNVHAEEFMIPDLKRKIKGPGKLMVYLTLQPCHNSGGHREVATHNGKNCTDLMIAFAREYPNLEITIKCSNIYRANWSDDSKFKNDEDLKLFKHKVVSAQEGIVKLLREPNIDVTGFIYSDWHFLVQHTKIMPKIKKTDWVRRFEMDHHITTFLDKMRLDVNRKSTSLS